MTGTRQAGDKVTAAMIKAGMAFAREFLGDAYPSMPLGEPELVSGIFDAMIAAAEVDNERLPNHRKEQ
jgi:hypothetical protein